MCRVRVPGVCAGRGTWLRIHQTPIISPTDRRRAHSRTLLSPSRPITVCPHCAHLLLRSPRLVSATALSRLAPRNSRLTPPVSLRSCGGMTPQSSSFEPSVSMAAPPLNALYVLTIWVASTVLPSLSMREGCTRHNDTTRRTHTHTHARTHTRARAHTHTHAHAHNCRTHTTAAHPHPHPHPEHSHSPAVSYSPLVGYPQPP